MAKGFSFEEALQPVSKGFSFEDALPTKPEPILSPEEQMMSSSVGQVTPKDPNASSVLANTTLTANAPAPTGRSFEEVAAGPDVSAVPKFDTTKMPTAEERAVSQFGITPEMGLGEKALRTGKAALYGASTGLEQTWLGGARMISDITGLGKEGVEGASKQLGKEQQAVEQTFAPEYGLKIAKDIGSSVVQTLPVMGVGLATNAAGALTTMFTQSFMQTYDDSRNEGLGVGASTARSALFGTAEALGESLGLGSLLKSAKSALKGVPTAELAKDLASYMVKEIPGEQLTYVSQFLTDKGFGLNPEAGLKEFFQGAIDTALVTVGQTAVMGSAGFTTNKILKDLRSLHSKGEEGIPQAADMMKAAGFTFEQAKQPQVTPVEITPAITPTPEQPAPAAEAPVQAAPAAPARVMPGAIQEADVEPETVTAVTPPAGKPTFDEWRTQQGLMFGSKEEYQAALPKLQAQYEAEMAGAPVVKEEPKALTGIEKKLDSLIKDKDSIIQQMADNYKISPAYAAKAYDAELEYTQAASRAYGDHPNKISEEDFTAAIKKHNNFFNKLKGVSERQKAKEVVQEPVQVEEPKQLAEKYYKPLTEYGWSGMETYGAGFPIVSKEKFVADHGEAELKKLQESGVVQVHPIEKGAQEDLVKRLGDYKDTFGNSGDFLWTTDLTISPDTHKTPEYQANYQKYANQPYTGEYEESNQEEYKAALEEQAKRKPTKEEKVAANKARQAEKKAKTEKPAKKEVGVASEEKMVDAIQSMAYKNGSPAKTTANQFIEKFGRKMFDDAVKADLLDNEPGEGRLFPSNRYAYEVAPKYYQKGKKIKAAEEKPAKKVEPKAKPKAEPKAVTKAGEAVDYAKIKKAAENQVDQAIKRTKFTTQKDYNDAKIPEAERYVDFKIEGAGSFKIMNNKERLEEFKKKLANAIKPKQAGIPRREWQTANVGFKADSAFKNFLDEKEPDTAIAIANITGLDITKVVLSPTQKKTLEKFIQEQKESGNEPMAETIKSKPGANVLGLAKILGPQLYGSMKDVTPVSVKEMIQNSFDAIKSTLEKGQIKKGFIQLEMKQATRTIEIKDNGSGMTPDTLANTFLTIAGTNKETEFGSGGFGIAKMLFLFGNKDIEVTTMRDGKIAHMETSGPQLMAALEDQSQAPDIEIMTPEQYGVNNVKDDFPDGHGTIVTVTVPETYVDQSTGKTEKIDFDSSKYSNPVLRYSPLFADIDVSMNGSPIDIGSKFPADDYTTFVNAKFKWGTARIYVSKDQSGKHGENLHVLSNGLWQFSNKLGKKPGGSFSENIPYTFYVDIVSKVKPNEPGYPFALNRKGFSQEAGNDLGLIQKYLWLNYMQKDFASTSTSFGNVEYVSKRNGKIETSPKESLNPDIQVAEIKDKIDEGSKVEVKDGKLIVNGKEIPELSQEDLSKAEINLDELQIDQDKIDPNRVMIHDNLEVNANPDAIKISRLENKQLEIIREQDKLREEKNALSTMNLLGKKKIDDQIKALDDKFGDVVTEKHNLKPKQEFAPITEAARREFGDRFDNFMYDIGDVFMALRDRIVYLNKVGKLPDHKTWKGDKSYAELAKEAIGISFDKEYRGVSIRLPFAGLFINPAFPEFINTPEEAGFGLFGTMIHELAHHQVRSHDADFPAEMQRLTLILKSDKDFDLQGLEKALVDSVSKNKDILDYLNKAGLQNDSRSIGQRFKDGSFEGAAERTSEDMAKSGGKGQPGRGIPSELRPSYQAIGQKPEPESVPSKAKAAKVDELLERYERSDTPLHPSSEVKDTIMGGYQKSKKIATKMAENPLMTAVNMVGKVDRGITYARNKNVWFGSGLDQADFARYNGQMRNAQGIAAASVAVTNAIHAGHVGTQVMVLGGLEFNYNKETGAGTQMFQAVKKDYSLANIVKLKHDLEGKLGEQRAANMVNAYFEAKRSRSIIEEFLKREGEYVKALESGQSEEEATKNLKNIEIARQKVNMDDDQIDEFIALEKDFPELRKMMDNWTKVNHNMLEMMAFSGVISKKREAQLKAIKDYVPWYRIMDDQTDIHQAVGVRGMTNVGQEKKFKAGQVNRDIDDIVDNMIHNVMMMTRNVMKNYAANQVALEYATRKENGKIQLYPTEGTDEKGVRTNIIMNGRRVIVNIPDPLVAEAVLGMENIEIPMIDILAFFAQGLRRGITTFPVFQVSQLFMDAPTAAWVSGVRNPIALMGSTFGGFVRALLPKDPVVAMLKSYGIGGYQSSARTPEKELKLEIGLLDKSVWAKAMKTLDHIGDASDYAQRRAIYRRVLKETTSKEFPNGDEMQALIQANNVIDFLKRGSGKGAQFVTRTVSFMNAYAQSIDVLAQALAGGGLKGKSRKAAQAQMIKTGMLLAGTTILYCMAAGADDEYDKLDDQTKLRNIIIPGTKIRLPMHTSASFFFKAIPELIYNKIMKDGTNNKMDNTRLRKALSEAAIDSLLGPNMIPTGVKPVAEIALNHNFFTGGTLTPKGMEKLESFRQYTSSTSEMGKVISALTGGVLNPIESDHLVRGLFGTAGAAVMYGSNLFSGDRVEPQAKDNPLYGSFILPEVPRGREDLFYDLKERSDKKYETFVDLMKKQHPREGQKYREENKGLINAHGFVTQADADLKRINAEIRRLSDLPESKMSSAEKRAKITKFQETKNNILEQTIKFRLKAGL